jgi:cytochrome P450
VEACAFEAMRLRPVAPLLPLQTRREMVIGDVRVPQGINVSSVMRLDSVSEAHVPDAAAFQPERWLAGGDTAAAGQGPGGGPGLRPAGGARRGVRPVSLDPPASG